MAEIGKTSRQLQAERAKEKIQQIVFEMAKTKTLEEIKIKDIARRADMSVGNFYQYFPSKEAALLYSYKTKDDVWASLGLENIKDPLDRVQRIIVTHITSLVENSLCFDTQLYIAQLKEFDAYFFTDDRFVHKAIYRAVEEGQKNGQFITTLSPKQIGLRLLNFTRGSLYNYCTERRENHDKWLEYILTRQSEYMSLFVTDKSKIRLREILEELTK